MLHVSVFLPPRCRCLLLIRREKNGNKKKKSFLSSKDVTREFSFLLIYRYNFWQLIPLSGWRWSGVARREEESQRQLSKCIGIFFFSFYEIMWKWRFWNIANSFQPLSRPACSIFIHCFLANLKFKWTTRTNKPFGMRLDSIVNQRKTKRFASLNDCVVATFSLSFFVSFLLQFSFPFSINASLKKLFARNYWVHSDALGNFYERETSERCSFNLRRRCCQKWSCIS